MDIFYRDDDGYRSTSQVDDDDDDGYRSVLIHKCKRAHLKRFDGKWCIVRKVRVLVLGKEFDRSMDIFYHYDRPTSDDSVISSVKLWIQIGKCKWAQVKMLGNKLITVSKVSVLGEEFAMDICYRDADGDRLTFDDSVISISQALDSNRQVQVGTGQKSWRQVHCC